MARRNIRVLPAYPCPDQVGDSMTWEELDAYMAETYPERVRWMEESAKAHVGLPD